MNPVPLLAIIGLYAAIWGLAERAFDPDADVDAYGLDQAPDIQPPEGGVFESIVNVFATIGGVFFMVLNAMTFNVTGAPEWIRVPISVMVIGSLSWSLVTLVRGN